MTDDVLQRCATAIAATFYGGSSGLDDMAQSIAEDHANAALSVLRPGDELPGGMLVKARDPLQKFMLRVGGIAAADPKGELAQWFRTYIEESVAMLAAAKEERNE